MPISNAPVIGGMAVRLIGAVFDAPAITANPGWERCLPQTSYRPL